MCTIVNTETGIIIGRNGIIQDNKLWLYVCKIIEWLIKIQQSEHFNYIHVWDYFIMTPKDSNANRIKLNYYSCYSLYITNNFHNQLNRFKQLQHIGRTTKNNYNL